MQVQDLNVNQIIEITLDEEGTNLKNLASRIEEVTDNYLHISIPTKKGQLMPFRVNQKLKIEVHYKGDFFQFDTIVENRKFYPFPILVVRKPVTLRQTQRRQWVRVPATLPLRYRLPSDAHFNPINLATTIDISGGGLCFLTNDPIEAGQILDMEINLPDREPVFCQIKVVRLQQPDGKKGTTTKVFSTYLDLTEAQRDRIISFVLEKQRVLIKKGLI